MNSIYTPSWKLALARVCPFLFWKCPGGALHWRWDERVCYHRVGQTGGGWHGGALVDGREYVPASYRQEWHPVLVRLLYKYDSMVAVKVGRDVCPKVVPASAVAHAVLDMEKAAQAARHFLGGGWARREPDTQRAFVQSCESCGLIFGGRFNYCPRCGRPKRTTVDGVEGGPVQETPSPPLSDSSGRPGMTVNCVVADCEGKMDYHFDVDSYVCGECGRDVPATQIIREASKGLQDATNRQGS